jgi:hypothetical protein
VPDCVQQNINVSRRWSVERGTGCSCSDYLSESGTDRSCLRPPVANEIVGFDYRDVSKHNVRAIDSPRGGMREVREFVHAMRPKNILQFGMRFVVRRNPA